MKTEQEIRDEIERLKRNQGLDWHLSTYTGSSLFNDKDSPLKIKLLEWVLS